MKKNISRAARTIGLIFLSVLIASPALPEEFHVTDATGLQNALNSARSNNQDDIIYLAAGTYQGNFTFNTTDAKSLAIRAEAGLSAPDVILDGGNSKSVLAIGGSTGGGAVTLEDLTIQNGGRSGIYVSFSGQRVHIFLNRTVLQNNSNEDRGGGIYLYPTGDATIDMEIWNSVLRNNQSQGYSDGRQGRGGGIWAHGINGNNLINLLIVNSLLYRNSANWSGGGVNLSASEVGDSNITRGKIINSTIVNNTLKSSDTAWGPGAGVNVVGFSGNHSSASLELYNTIIYGNTLPGGAMQDLVAVQDDPGKASIIASSCNIGVAFISTWRGTPTYDSVNVINSAPLFSDPAHDIYRLAADSPCIDTGTSAVPSPPGLPEEDLDGNPRVNGPFPDIGAYEVSGLSVVPDEGTIGTGIEVYGSGFGTRRNKILLGTTALKILQWTDGWIRASIDKALAPGIYDLTVQPKGAPSIVLEGAFTVKAPEIGTVEPGTGSVNDEITLRGFFFGNKKGKVTLGGKNCRVKSWTSEIRFVVPRGLSTGTHELKITNGVGSDTTPFTVE